MENWRAKNGWLNSVEKQKRRSDLKEQRDRHTDRVNDKKNNTPRLGAESIINSHRYCATLRRLSRHIMVHERI